MSFRLSAVWLLVAPLALHALAQPAPGEKRPPQLPSSAAERAQTIVPARTAPSVSLGAPTGGSVFNLPAAIMLQAQASASNRGAEPVSVSFHANGAAIATAGASPYVATWSPTTPATYELTAVATDRLGVSTTSAPVAVRINAPPSASLTAPAAGTAGTAPASVTLSAQAADSDGTVTKVDFYASGVLIGTAPAAPYVLQWHNVAAGAYSLTALATDNDGSTITSAAVPIRINAAPTVSLTSPADQSSFTAPAEIALTADARDADGSIAQVDFYSGDSLIATRAAAPFSIVWTGVPPGAYVLSAKARDNDGAEVASTAVAIIVTEGIAKLYFIHVDHLNTPRLVADENQKTVWRWDQQEPFGNNPADENPAGLGTFELPLRLPGQYFDKETNLHYNYFRDYDPGIGIYVESDPIGLDGGINTYAYVGSKPLTHVDRMGLLACGPDNDFRRYLIPDSPGGFEFARCCKRHDRCYEECRAIKVNCDDAFINCTKNKCDQYAAFVRPACRAAGYTYYSFIIGLGDEPFMKAQEIACQQCMPREKYSQ